MLPSSSPETYEKIPSGEWDADGRPQAEDRQVSHMLGFQRAHDPEPRFLEIGIPGICQLPPQRLVGGEREGEEKGWGGSGGGLEGLTLPPCDRWRRAEGPEGSWEVPTRRCRGDSAPMAGKKGRKNLKINNKILKTHTCFILK